MSTDICWSHVLRFFRHPRTVVDPTPFVDDSQRRLTRASEAPRRLDLHQDSGFRALHGRDPPGL